MAWNAVGDMRRLALRAPVCKAVSKGPVSGTKTALAGTRKGPPGRPNPARFAAWLNPDPSFKGLRGKPKILFPSNRGSKRQKLPQNGEKSGKSAENGPDSHRTAEHSAAVTIAPLVRSCRLHQRRASLAAPGGIPANTPQTRRALQEWTFTPRVTRPCRYRSLNSSPAGKPAL